MRYSPAYLIWDRAGRIWNGATARWPKLKARTATPNQIRFFLENRAELGLELERAFVSFAGNNLKLEEFIPYCAYFSEEATRSLEIDSFKRVGFKVTYVKRYEDMDGAVADFISTGVFKKIPEVNFGIKGQITQPSFGLRFENENVGCVVVFQVRKREINMDVPIIGEEDLVSQHREYTELVLEFDYYAQNMEIDQFKCSKWLEEAMHVMRRDAAMVLRA
jgi:hypothetical protein